MFHTAKDAKEFTLAGLATLTLKSLKTGKHYTYRINKPKKQAEELFFPNDTRFVSLLTNGDQYVYIGMIRNGQFTLTQKSKLPAAAQPVAAFQFFIRNIVKKETIPSQLEIRHEGSCGRCGRPLTVPESIDRGIGPECIKYLVAGSVLADL